MTKVLWQSGQTPYERLTSSAVFRITVLLLYYYYYYYYLGPSMYAETLNFSPNPAKSRSMRACKAVDSWQQPFLVPPL